VYRWRVLDHEHTFYRFWNTFGRYEADSNPLKPSKTIGETPL
jgi:hypothetical protein